MRLDRPAILALTVSFIMGVILLIIGLAIDSIVQNLIEWKQLGFMIVLAMILVFILIRYTVDQFIYSKVKIIYKNIHDLKVGSDVDEDEVARSTDLDDVTREVSEWAEQQENEILELKSREKYRREFVGNIFHELKTPIFNIQGYLLTLLDGALEEPEVNEKYLKRANKSVDRMINIIDSMETISNLEANRINIKIADFDIVEIVKDSFELLEDNAKKRKIKLKLKKEYDRPIRVSADRQKIEQVFVNLIINAIKYGTEGGQIEVRFFDMDKNVLVEVADDGLGIPQEDIPRIFERFYRVDKSRSREAGGTGLGLAIVKHILESHKQSISVRSSENAGSTFSFTLKKSK
jgi:two-component system phosphate regulon sensor histidine kinase PhoR